MREIKFRAWDYQQKRMIYFDNLDMWDTNWLNEPDICMQYTGLKDKNGKEIYESDILKYEVDTFKGQTDWGVEERIDKVYFDVKGSVWWPLVMGNTKSFQVIGNIYENPELL